MRRAVPTGKGRNHHRWWTSRSDLLRAEWCGRERPEW